MPVWLQYSSFNAYGKTIEMRMGEMFGKEVVEGLNHPAGINRINTVCAERLLDLSQKYTFHVPAASSVMRGLLFIPAMLGAVIHAPVYLPIQSVVKKLSKGNVHFDSMMLAFLMVAYPLYLLLLSGALVLITQQWWPLLLLIILPLLAKCYQLWKK
jgi:1-acyl-sn-glycerol-3-phosphate acyltransferase